MNTQRQSKRFDETFKRNAEELSAKTGGQTNQRRDLIYGPRCAGRNAA